MGVGKPVKYWCRARRSNPLRRREDIVEAWIMLVVCVVAVTGGAVAGLLTAQATDEALARRRAERHSVRAVLLTDVPKQPPTVRSPDGKALAQVRWTAPDGSVRTDRTRVETGLKAGAGVVVWQDSRGTLAPAPASPREAAVEAAALGTLTGLAFVGGACALGAVARLRLDRRRIDAWGREWDLVGPTWGHKTG